MVKTTKIAGDKDYALVPDRLKEFRSENPRALVETKPDVQADGSVIFSARILKDKAEASSAEATGTARYSAKEMEKAKAFEKLETVSVGRALALLGYLNNGQVATSEEMVEFEEYKQEQMELIFDEISNATTQQEFKDILAKLTPEQKRLATPLINERIQELKNAKAD